MADILEFRTKKLTGFILDEEFKPEQDGQPPIKDTAPSEYSAPLGDSA